MFHEWKQGNCLLTDAEGKHCLKKPKAGFKEKSVCDIIKLYLKNCDWQELFCREKYHSI